VLTFSLFRIFKALLTWRFALSLLTSFIAFYKAAARYKTLGKGTSSSVIRRNAPKTSRVGTRPSGLAESLSALKLIYSTMFLYKLGSCLLIIL